jgi:colicin import membrane protein
MTQEATTAKSIINVEAITKEDARALYIDGGVDKILDFIDKIVRAEPQDLKSKKGRQAIRSTAYAISRCKTVLDDKGKELTEQQRKEIDTVNAVRRRVREFCDNLRAEFRQPLIDFQKEIEEKKRAYELAQKKEADEIEAYELDELYTLRQEKLERGRKRYRELEALGNTVHTVEELADMKDAEYRERRTNIRADHLEAKRLEKEQAKVIEIKSRGNTRLAALSVLGAGGNFTAYEAGIMSQDAYDKFLAKAEKTYKAAIAQAEKEKAEARVKAEAEAKAQAEKDEAIRKERKAQHHAHIKRIDKEALAALVHYIKEAETKAEPVAEYLLDCIKDGSIDHVEIIYGD